MFTFRTTTIQKMVAIFYIKPRIDDPYSRLNREFKMKIHEISTRIEKLGVRFETKSIEHFELASLPDRCRDHVKDGTVIFIVVPSSQFDLMSLPEELRKISIQNHEAIFAATEDLDRFVRLEADSGLAIELGGAAADNLKSILEGTLSLQKNGTIGESRGENNQENGLAEHNESHEFVSGAQSTSLFIGRGTELAEIRDTILNGESKAYFGVKGIGRTSLLKRLLDPPTIELMFETKAGEFVFAYVNLSEFEFNDHFSGHFWFRLYDQLGRVLLSMNPQDVVRDLLEQTKATFDDVKKLVRILDDKHSIRVVFLIESLNLLYNNRNCDENLLTEIQMQLRSISIEYKLTLLCTSDERLDKHDSTPFGKSPLFNILHPLYLPPISFESLIDLNKFMPPEHLLNRLDLKLISRLSGGIPALMTLTYEEIRNTKLTTKPVAVEGDYIKAIRRAFDRAKLDGSLQRIWDGLNRSEKVAVVLATALRLNNSIDESTEPRLLNETHGRFIRILRKENEELQHRYILKTVDEAIQVSPRLLELYALEQVDSGISNLATQKWPDRTHHPKSDLDFIDNTLDHIKTNFSTFRETFYYRIPPGKTKCQIFLSYSHHDISMKSELMRYLRALEDQNVRIWDDEKLRVAEPMAPRIIEELKNSQIIIMLVSQPFLTSGFITDHEVPQALENYRTQKSRLFPIILSDCKWQEKYEWLNRILYFPSEGKTLADFTSDMDKSRAMKKIYSQLNEQIDEFLDKK